MVDNSDFTRREFLKKTALTAGAASLGLPNNMMGNNLISKSKKMLTMARGHSWFEREPLIHSYGFKGGYITRLWQVVSQLKDAEGNKSIGLGVQSPLWSDSSITSLWGESGSNAIMFNLTSRALQILSGQSFDTPIQMIEDAFDEVHAYGIKLTNNTNLRKTFTLNALTSVDNAAWLLYAKQNKIDSFTELIPSDYREAFSHKTETIASIPSISYSTSTSGIEEIKNSGQFFIKIKIGSPGSQQEMLEKDMHRIKLIDSSLRSATTQAISNKKFYYYLDANGRYHGKETLVKLLDHCDRIKVLDKIAIVEEPFPEALEEDVSDLGARIAADESAHTDKEAQKRIEMGYTGIALKAMGKTLSNTIKIAKLAHDKGIPCFCTDLTVNPILVDWNKLLASHLPPFPGLKVGLLETNGSQNYKNWNHMISYHPRGEASWNKPKNGLFTLNESFYRESGGIFLEPDHYKNL
ncbi:enolase C-terminal domain-like protein [Flagellimonas algicola]|uniref:Twin-arginine translocation signal domain-containing protein n=1 Tax=Flagellimonas algicola TaxID=2583815 RepID=A0ABY2WH47_9FLAO|nr:enolase C-terminal domain-like protein [Allomuricauda algicola]TMU50713.1 twin-arginine translocation signal domain-containing protein [Allomuricauda algicola]